MCERQYLERPTSLKDIETPGNLADSIVAIFSGFGGNAANALMANVLKAAKCSCFNISVTMSRREQRDIS